MNNYCYKICRSIYVAKDMLISRATGVEVEEAKKCCRLCNVRYQPLIPNVFTRSLCRCDDDAYRKFF